MIDCIVAAQTPAIKMVEHLDDANLKVVIAVVVGLFFLLGALVGAS